MRNTIALVKSHVRFSNHEVFLILGYALLMGFLFSFTKWGDETGAYSLSVGLSQWAYYAALSFIVVLSVIFFQKFSGSHIGIIPTFHVTWAYIITSLILIVLTNGKVLLFFPPGFVTEQSLRNMLGRNRYFEAFSDFIRIGASGIFLCVVFGIFFSLKFIPQSLVPLKEIFFFYAIFSLIPIDIIFSWNVKKPALSNGMAILYPSRPLYIAILIFVLVAYVLSFTQTFFFSLLLSVILAIIAGLVWFLYKEKFWGE
jgi:hypothetical protein